MTFSLDFGALASVGQSATPCGRSAVADITASVLPEASGIGYVSISAVVTCTASPPEVGTFQMWRRSMSPTLVE